MVSASERVASLLETIEATKRMADEERQPSRAVVDQAAELGLLRLLVPRSYGGEEASPLEFLEIVEALATADGSVAWTIMTCNEEAEIACAHLPGDTMSALYAEHPEVVIAGSGVARGVATPAGADWRVTGRWDFISGGTVADRIVLTSLTAQRRPATIVHVLVDPGEITFLDTWHTVGLRGTGSGDVALDDLLVERRWCGVSDAGERLVPDAALYRLPAGLRFPFPKVGVASGIAAAAIDAFAELAASKAPLTRTRPLRERADAASAIAAATALRSAGRALVVETLDELWTVATEREPVSAELHARVRLACSFAVQNCIAAVETLGRAAGSTTNRLDGPLAQLAVDVRAVAGHFTVAPYQMDTAGRVLLGLDAGDRSF